MYAPQEGANRIEGANPNFPHRHSDTQTYYFIMPLTIFVIRFKQQLIIVVIRRMAPSNSRHTISKT
jgi:hypothetical protein